MTCVVHGAFTICYGGQTEVLRVVDEPPRWCYGERKRQPGKWLCMAYVGPSYYDPWWRYQCDGCGADRRLFPGWTEVFD